MTAQPRSNGTSAAEPLQPQDSTYDVAAGRHARGIEQTLALVDDLLRVVRTRPDIRAILEQVRADLELALEWRFDNYAGADAAADRRALELAELAEANVEVETVRAALEAFGADWRRTVPTMAWRARKRVHLSIIEAEHDPVALAAALDRVYGPEVAR